MYFFYLLFANNIINSVFYYVSSRICLMFDDYIIVCGNYCFFELEVLAFTSKLYL